MRAKCQEASSKQTDIVCLFRKQILSWCNFRVAKSCKLLWKVINALKKQTNNKTLGRSAKEAKSTNLKKL